MNVVEIVQKHLGPTGSTIVFAVVTLAAVLIILQLGRIFSIWLRAKLSNAPVSLFKIAGMSLRRVPFPMIVDNRITLVKAGLMIDTDPLEAHYLAGGDVNNVVLALVAATKAGLGMTLDRACAMDLSLRGTRRTVLEAVRTSINPTVIDCPPQGPGGEKRQIEAVTRDGVSVFARARITVRTNLSRFIGGATEETIVARVAQELVTAIGSTPNHMQVLENPSQISKQLLDKGLEASTAFDILSIDLADIDLGSNRSAKLLTQQAEADKEVALAKTEVRRTSAVASEQEMKAKEQEMRARLLEAEAQLPVAIAEAFRNGNLGVMDYTRYRNVLADTGMRESIARGA